MRFLSLDPGDMDTPLHALAVPDADPATLKRPETAAREIADADLGRTDEGARVIAAAHPVQRPADARLLVIDGTATIAHAARSGLADFLQPGDLVIANDAATLPASLHGVHLPSGAPIEVRLAGRSSLAPEDLRFSAVVFGAGDWRTRTEDRPPSPPLAPGDRLSLGPLAREPSTACSGTRGWSR